MMNLFQSWSELGRVALTGVLAYIAVVLLIRAFGSRSTAKMNNFDWIVTVALGSLLASVIMVEDAVLMDGLVAITVLLLLQFVFTSLSTRSERFRRAMLHPPHLLYYDGHFLDDALAKQRVPRREVEQAVREAGYSDLAQVQAVVMESNAELSVLGKSGHPPKLLEKVVGFEPRDDGS